MKVNLLKKLRTKIAGEDCGTVWTCGNGRWKHDRCQTRRLLASKAFHIHWNTPNRPELAFWRENATVPAMIHCKHRVFSISLAIYLWRQSNDDDYCKIKDLVNVSRPLEEHTPAMNVPTCLCLQPRDNSQSIVTVFESLISEFLISCEGESSSSPLCKQSRFVGQWNNIGYVLTELFVNSISMIPWMRRNDA